MRRAWRRRRRGSSSDNLVPTGQNQTIYTLFITTEKAEDASRSSFLLAIILVVNNKEKKDFEAWQQTALEKKGNGRLYFS